MPVAGKGRSRYAHEVERIRRELPRPEEAFPLVVGHRDPVSRLAFHPPDRPFVHHWEEPGVIVSQYELRPVRPSSRGRDALVIVAGAKRTLFITLRRHGETRIRLETLAIPLGPGRTRGYAPHRCRNRR